MCSKGCNQLIKVDKGDDKGDTLAPTHGSDNAQTAGFELVVCQADKRIVCEGGVAYAVSLSLSHQHLFVGDGSNRLAGKHGRSAVKDQNSKSCTQEKEVPGH